jgi:hypothetical protein
MSSNRFPSNPMPPLWEIFQTLQDARKEVMVVLQSKKGKRWTRGFRENAGLEALAGWWANPHRLKPLVQRFHLLHRGLPLSLPQYSKKCMRV